MDKTELNIEGMTCNHCVMRVQKGLEAVPGVKSVKVNLASKNAIVEAETGSVSPEMLILTVQKTGYKASLK